MMNYNNSGYNIDTNGILNIMLDGQNYRSIQIDGQDWIIADDLAKQFGVRKGADLVRSIPNDASMVRAHKVCLNLSDGRVQPRSMLVISEAGLDMLCMRSNNPELRQFQYKVLDIIHNVRHMGAYIDPNIVNSTVNDPQIAQEYMQNYQQYQEKMNKLQQERDTYLFRNLFWKNWNKHMEEVYGKQFQGQQELIEDMEEMASFGESVIADSKTISLGQLAKFMFNKGLNIGRNRLCEVLREEGWLMKVNSEFNLPTQKALEYGYMQIGYASTNKGIIPVTRVTKLGQMYFMSMYCDNN